MNSRERVRLALQHQEPDKIPLDLGSAPVTGMHVQSVYRLRQALGLDEPGTPVKIIDPFQNLGEIKPDLADALGVDVVGIWPRKGLFGFENTGWKEWEAFDGTPVLVPEGYNTEPEPNGDILMYPEGDKSVPPSGQMPAGGWYFDALIRQPPIDDDNLNVEDNLEEFGPLDEADLQHFEREINRVYEETDKAILVNIGGTAFGDIALVPATWLRHPKGIRDVEEWYVSLLTRQDYIIEVFDRQSQIALENLQKLYEVAGNRIDILYMTGTDFGGQQQPLISPRVYKKVFQPFHKRLNDWIHANTTWKTFMHTDGSLMPLIPHFIEAGFDILNPVQWTAQNMDPCEIKSRFGANLTFWGAGIDTQKTLPFGTPDEVRAEVIARIRDFAPGGGFVFASVHNIQPMVPVENLLALYETFNEHRNYA